LVGSWETLPHQNSTYLLFCTGKYCNTATTNLLCARGRIKISQKMIRRNLIMVSTRRSPQKKTRPTRVPTLSGQACVRAGAHPARVGARLRLDAPQRGRNGGGVGLDAVAGGAGRGPIGRLAWAYWSAPPPPPPTSLATVPRRRRRRRRVCGGVSLWKDTATRAI